MNAIMEWFKASGWAGMSHGTWVGLGALAGVEMLLGRSSDPRFRSVADSIRNLLVMVLSKVPGAGPLLVRLLQAMYVLPAPKPELAPAPPKA